MELKSKREYFVSTIQVIGIVILFIVIARRSFADDVFNFYFQKGGAPQSVVQSGGGQSTQNAAQAEPVQQSTPVPVISAQKIEEAPKQIAAPVPYATPTQSRYHTYTPYSVLLGFTQIDDAVGSAGAYTLGLQYNFNKFLGTRLQGHFLAPESERPNFKLTNSDESSNRYGGFGSLVFTPLHMELVGHQMLDVSLHGGLMSYREKGGATVDSVGQETLGVKTEVKGFIGASALFSLNENFGIEAFASMLDGGKLGRVTGSAVLRF